MEKKFQKPREYSIPGISISYEKRSIHEIDYWKDKTIQPKNVNKLSFDRLCSISKKLHLDNKIDDKFEIMLNNLSLEEIIALKLELSSKIINNKLFKFPLYHSLLEIMRDAVVKYACSTGNNCNEIAAILGVTRYRSNILKYKYENNDYFATFKKVRSDLRKTNRKIRVEKYYKNKKEKEKEIKNEN